MIKFSIIIPVFNSEKTIRRCLDSIIKQTYKNFEVLVMDDGSFDNSLNICTEYQLKDERFKVYSQKNSGPSEARNYCLNQSTGSWICFVDSDDWIGEDYLESLCNEITQNNPEIIFIGYKATNIITNHTNIKVPSFLNVNDSYYMSLLKLSEQDMFGYTWIKIIRKDVIQGLDLKVSYLFLKMRYLLVRC